VQAKKSLSKNIQTVTFVAVNNLPQLILLNGR